MVGETRDSWSSYEKKAHPSNRLIRIEDCHLEACTEWIGVRSEEGEGKASIYSSESLGAIKDSIIADVFFDRRYEEALVRIINKACHPEGHSSMFLI